MAAAASLGAEVVVATEHTPPMASEMEDRLVSVDFSRPEASAAGIAALDVRSPLDAVVGVDDRGVLIAAHANEMLGHPHNPPDAVAATRNKIDMRSVLEAWGVPQPAFRVAGPDDDVASLAQQVGLPCVIKPISLSASTGVIRADSPDQATEVAHRVRRILAKHERSTAEPLLVEEFVPGAEVSIEGILRDGELEILAIFDKPYPLDGPYFEESIYVTPSRLAQPNLDAAIRVAEQCCRALGLREGSIHAELRVDEARGEAKVIEVAARSIGGLCSRVLRFGAGISLEEVILAHALGLDLDSSAQGQSASGVMMLPIPRSGVLCRVDGIDAARGVDGISGVEITATLGRPIEAIPEGGRYLGFIFGSADTPAQVEAALIEAHSCLDVVITDERRHHSEGDSGTGPDSDRANHIERVQIRHEP